MKSLTRLAINRFTRPPVDEEDLQRRLAYLRAEVELRLTVRLRTISVPPGWKLLRFVNWIYSATTVSRVFRPPILDMQHEHIEALATGQLWKARWVLLRGYWSVCSAMVAQAPLSLLKQLIELWKAAS